MTKIKTDPKLVARAIEGDRESFALIYKDIYGDLYKYALFTLKSPEEAQDAVSETVLDLFKGIHTLKEPGSFGAWVFRILSLKCKKRIGSLIAARNTLDIEDLREREDPLKAGTEESVTESETLNAALDSLKEEDRMVLLLSSVYGYKNKEISQIMDLPAGTVSSKLARGYEKMRKMLGGENHV